MSSLIIRYTNYNSTNPPETVSIGQICKCPLCERAGKRTKYGVVHKVESNSFKYGSHNPKRDIDSCIFEIE